MLVRFSAAELQVYTLQSGPLTYNFTDHAYSSEQPDRGVRFTGVVSDADSIAIVIDTALSTPATAAGIDYYGSDSGFSTPANTTQMPVRMVYPILPGSGNRFCFTVKPANASEYTRNFRIYLVKRCTLTVTAAGPGRTIPSGTVTLWSRLSFALAAEASQNGCFNGWHASGGSTIADPGALRTTISADTSSGTITADFATVAVHAISFIRDTLSFETDGCRPVDGVLMRFTPPSVDTFIVSLGWGSGTHTGGLRWTWFHDDSTFSRADSVSAVSYTIPFRVAAGQVQYFRIRPERTADTAASFSVKADSLYVLTITQPATGTVTPSGSMLLPGGESRSVLLTLPSYRYMLAGWQVVSGMCTVSDTLSMNPQIRVDSSDAEVRPSVIMKNIWPLHTDPDTFSYLLQGTWASGGICAVFTSDDADSFRLELRKPSAHGNTVFYYGTDSTFTTVLGSRTLTATNYYDFRATAAGESHYFRIMAGSQTNDRYTCIAEVFRYCTLTVRSEIGGILQSPSFHYAREDSSVALTAPAAGGRWYFSNWTVSEGAALFADSSRTTTPVTISHDATVTAVYPERPLQQITDVWDTLRYRDVAGGPSGGILFTFTNPQYDSFSLVFRSVDPHSMTLYCYDADSTCTAAVRTTSGTSVAVTVPAGSGVVRYLRVVPVSAADTVDRVQFRYYRYVTLTQRRDAGGEVVPYLISRIREDSAYAIVPPQISGRYWFDRWRITAGSGTLSDSTVPSTRVTAAGDVTVNAVFGSRPVITVGFSSDTTGYRDIEGGTRGGILFSCTAQQADTQYILFGESASRMFTVTRYGTDSSCSTEVSVTHPTGTVQIPFVAAAAGGVQYFKVSYYNVADTVDEIFCRMLRYCTLTCISDGGTVTPAIRRVEENGTVAVSAIPSTPLLMFDHWRLSAGHATIVDSVRQSTTITMDSTDATVEALFTDKTIHSVTAFDSVYTFGTDDGGTGNTGVLFRFTAPSADTFAITAVTAAGDGAVYLIDQTTDSLFETAADTAVGDTACLIFAASAGETRWFRGVSTSGSDDASGNQFVIRYRDVHSLSLSAGEGGRLTADGTWRLPDSFTVADSAWAPTALWYFDRWVTQSGTIMYRNGSDSLDALITVAPAGSDAAAEAHFSRRTVYDAETSPVSFGFGSEGAPGNMVLLRYTASAADSFILRMTIPAACYYTIEYYRGDSTFSTVAASVRNSNAAEYRFRAVAMQAGEEHFFRISTSAAYASRTFTVDIDTAVTLLVNSGGRGVTVPADSLRVMENSTVALHASAVSPRYFFTGWHLISGDAAIADPSLAATAITVQSSSAVEAQFGSKNIHAVGFTTDTLSYAVDGTPQASGGILLSFTAPRADSFACVFSDAGTYSRSINWYAYGTDSAMTVPVQQHLNSPKNSMAFFRTATAGETWYFRVEPVNPTFYRDSVAVAVKPLVPVDIRSAAGGTTMPSGIQKVIAGTVNALTAAPLGDRYGFDGWTVSGGASVADPSGLSTTFCAYDTAVVTAQFTAQPIREIPRVPVPAVYRYDADASKGVFLSMTCTPCDSFYLYVRHDIRSTAATLFYYGSDSLFRTVAGTRSLTSAGDTLCRFAGATGPFYFRLAPAFSGDTGRFSIMWNVFDTLIVTTDGGGTVQPSGPVNGPPGTSVQIGTVPAGPLFTFRQWTVTGGFASIADSLAAVTLATIDVRGGGAVKALYNVRPHDTLFVWNDGHGITVPFDYLLLDTTADTLVAAYPDRFWLFDRWEVVSGSPQLTDLHGQNVRVRCDGTTVIRAHFKADPKAAPQLVINDINSTGFPDIEVTVTLRDGVHQLPDDAASFFTVEQDSQTPEFTIDRLTDLHGVSVSLILDKSQTMGVNGRIDTARAAARSFIEAMGPLDKAAVVAFSTGASVVQQLTSDRQALLSSLGTIVPAGETAIRDGAYAGVRQLEGETATRAAIIFSDGFENASSTDIATVIAYAREQHVAIYSIAVGAEAIALVDATLRPLADSTGGMLYYARSTSDLAALYMKIRADIETRYLMRYVSPDTVEDGDLHQVTVSAQVNGSSVGDTAQWKERNAEVTVVLPDTDSATSDTGTRHSTDTVTVDVIIRESDSIPREGTLCYRAAGSTDSFVCSELVHVVDSLYRAVVTVDSMHDTELEFRAVLGDTAKPVVVVRPDTQQVAMQNPASDDSSTTGISDSTGTDSTDSGNGTSTGDSPQTGDGDSSAVVTSPVNHPPQVTVDDDGVVVNGDTVIITVHAEDADGDSVHYRITGGSGNATIEVNHDGSATVTIVGADINGSGPYAVITADDGIDTVEVTFMAPDTENGSTNVTLAATTDDTLVPAGSTVAIGIASEGAKLCSDCFIVNGLPDGAVFTFDTERDSGTIVWTPSEGRQDAVVTISAVTEGGIRSDTITIHLRSGRYEATAACVDTNGNGYIDKIIIGWGGDARLTGVPSDARSWIDDAFVVTAGDTLRLVPATMTERDSMTAEVTLRENRTRLHTCFDTAVMIIRSTPVTRERFPTVITRIGDAAGPVIRSARVKGGGISDGGRSDSLIIVFSEPVRWKHTPPGPQHLLACFGPGKTEALAGLGTGAVLRCDADGIVIAVRNGYSFINNRDSMALRSEGEGELFDRAGNGVHHDNRHVPVEVAVVDDAAICPNPFVPGRSIDPSSGRQGTMIIVQYTDGDQEIFGEVTVFNALGDVVIGKKGMSPHPQQKRWLVWLWDGRDTRGNIVGGGMYAVKIDLYGNDRNKLTTLYRKVGVVREQK